MATFIAIVKNGALHWGSPYNVARLNDWMKRNEGAKLKLEKQQPIRSLTQNAFYWVWLAKVELETGNQTEDMHVYLKSKFLPKRLVKIKGKEGEHTVMSDGTTTKLSKLEFGEYLDKCAAHVGIPLPTREEIEAMGYLPN